MPDEEPSHPLLQKPWTYDLVRIDWRPSPAIQETCIDLTFRKESVVRRLRFAAPSCVKIDEGFYGQCSGLEIFDIRARGWADIQIQVANFEQDPGITFFAESVVDLDHTEGL